MLIQELKRQYYVYPAYAKFRYQWEDLPTLFADPYRYSESWQLNHTREDIRKYGYPEIIQPFDLVDGPVGGGIIIAHIGFVGKISEKWLPHIILQEGANLCSPDSMYETDCFNVCYLEPEYNRAADYGVESKIIQYHIGSTVEHINSAPGRVFWLFSVTTEKKVIPELDDVSLLAKHFGLDVKNLADVPENIVEEVGGWLFEPKTQYICYDVKSNNNSMGYNFAVLMYIGLHLARQVPNKIKSVHLLAEIEGNIRSERWSRCK